VSVVLLWPVEWLPIFFLPPSLDQILNSPLQSRYSSLARRLNWRQLASIQLLLDAGALVRCLLGRARSYKDGARLGRPCREVQPGQAAMSKEVEADVREMLREILEGEGGL
jgi:hypothetical protein